MKKLIFILALALIFSSNIAAQSPQQTSIQLPSEDSPEALQQYVPVLPSVKAQYWQIDPKLGYAVQSVGGGVYVVSDNGWQSAFLVTDEGVIVFDAPASFGKSLLSAIAKVTDKPIKMLVYSHVHKDHIGGSVAFKDIKDLQDRCARHRRRLPEGDERSESIGAERDVQDEEDRSRSGARPSSSPATIITRMRAISSSTSPRPNS